MAGHSSFTPYWPDAPGDVACLPLDAIWEQISPALVLGPTTVQALIGASNNIQSAINPNWWFTALHVDAIHRVFTVQVHWRLGEAIQCLPSIAAMWTNVAGLEVSVPPCPDVDSVVDLDIRNRAWQANRSVPMRVEARRLSEALHDIGHDGAQLTETFMQQAALAIVRAETGLAERIIKQIRQLAYPAVQLAISNDQLSGVARAHLQEVVLAAEATAETRQLAARTLTAGERRTRILCR